MKTKRGLLRAVTAAFSLAAGAGSAATLDDVKARGKVICGVSTGLAGFAEPDAEGYWNGFDVAFCRAVATAVLRDQDAVEFVPLDPEARFTALAAGDIDLLSRNTTWTFIRDVDLEFTFAGVSYYDGQGFIVPTSLGVRSATELDGVTICVQNDTTTELNLADFFRANEISYVRIPVATNTVALERYAAGACTVYTSDASALAASRATFDDPKAHVILPEIISKEPLGPLVREGDDQWADIVRWVLNAMIAAEEYGVTSANVSKLAQGTPNPEINRLLGHEGSLGEMLGLRNDWAVNVIQTIGNYGEVFAKTIGETTETGLSRGLNAQWSDGGLLYAPPFR